jgi:plasmid stabilization system protein ParE
MKEIWTNEAKKTFSQNVAYINSRWKRNVVDTFIDKTFTIIDLLKSRPTIGQYDERWDAYKILVVSQIYLYYELKEGNLVIITFWNNYQKPLFQ